MSVSRHHPKLAGEGGATTEKGNLTQGKKADNAPARSCVLCLPESSKHSSPKALLPVAEGKIFPCSWPAFLRAFDLLLRPYPLVIP